MLRFKSEPIRLLLTFLRAAPLAAGYVSETQTVKVKLRGFLEGNVPTSCLKVKSEQRAEFWLGAGIPQIYDASLILKPVILPKARPRDGSARNTAIQASLPSQS